jgi:hypothetical protein
VDRQTLGDRIRCRVSERARSLPEKVGIVSTSLITAKVAGIESLLARDYSCVVLDEAHRARAGNANATKGQPNNLMSFMRKLARRTRTLLLGSATPIQLDRGELYDLIELLSFNHDRVLGGVGSCWRNRGQALDIVSGLIPPIDSIYAVALAGESLASGVGEGWLAYSRTPLG